MASRARAELADAPDSVGAAGSTTQAVSPTARNPAANDIEHVDELQPTPMAVSGPADDGGIPGFVEPTAAEGEAAEGDPVP